MSAPEIDRFAPPEVGLRSGNRTLVSAIRGFVDPLVPTPMLVLSTTLWGGGYGSAQAVLSVLAFALLYPGTIPYRRRRPGFARDVLVRWSMVVGVLAVVGLAFDLLRLFDQQALVTWIVATPIAQIVIHWLAPTVLPRFVALRPERSAIVVAANEVGRAIARSIREDPLSNTRIAAYFDDRAPDRLGPLEAPLAGPIAKTAAYAKTHGIEQVFIALPMSSQPRILKLLDELRDTTASIHFLPDVFAFDLIQARLDTVGGLPVVTVCETPYQGVAALGKRISDVAIAAAALFVFAPIMLAAAAAVRLESPGPAIFRQRRYGMDGREIVIYKFRTMTVLEDGVGDYTQVRPDDERVTRVGRWLRRTSLDELPQFVNVLQGRMSVVGPRPHAVAVNELYRRQIPGYMQRHKIRPGITGLAQVHGYRGGDDLNGMRKRIEYDLKYLRNWSIGLDLWIMARTLRLLVGDRRAF